MFMSATGRLFEVWQSWHEGSEDNKCRDEKGCVEDYNRTFNPKTPITSCYFDSTKSKKRNNKESLEKIEQFIKERDWSQFHDPKNLAISLNLEAAEVLELFQWTKNNEINKNKMANLKDELADVYYWLLLLADHYDIDIESALEEKIKKNEKKYPIDKSKGSSEKYSEFN
jgi:NTP pyrophosphatase (non-canonical NTP hydrolase)